MPNDEFGDFQTPVGLARAVLRVLQGPKWGRILEPTSGTGVFLRVAANEYPDSERKGLEINEAYAHEAGEYGDVVVGDALQTNFRTEFKWATADPLLVIGNPPWVTNAALSSLGSTNKPKLENLRVLKGLDAMTGASNFDIAEAIILKLIRDLERESPTIALLCKTQVARNVLSYCEQFDLPIVSSRMYGIDAKKWFDAGVDACLFVVELSPSGRNYVADVYSSLDAIAPTKQIGVVDGRLVSDVEKYSSTKAADGESPIEWRQGIKHDATQVMELVEDGGPRTKSGEAVDIESDFLFPLAKCTDVYRDRYRNSGKWMVVPQRHTGDDTRKLAIRAPKLWTYLERNADALDGRKSSIYRNRSRFCIFGIGEYSFAPYKVAISGMHKDPVFRLVSPQEGRPVVFDDVCYFASFESIFHAALVTAILSSGSAQALLQSLSFTDSKRPITKKLLQRLDLRVLVELSSEDDILTLAQEIARPDRALPTEQLAVALRELKVNWSQPSGSEMLELDPMAAVN